MKYHSERAHLYLNGELVGDVDVQGSDTGWTFGAFRPNDAFSKHAPHFGRWAMLMHEDIDRKLHPAASEELRHAEVAIDRIAAKLHYIEKDRWEHATQLNIDGAMIEWKEY